ncbi:hypothetical protein [Paracoccus aminovorans]|uniref:hypothetical protein n=1 Tax=Paracoccus aminovorans TaxID=34004 RepID=UPI000B1A6EF6|nr:hypothetical protein [Paracoccus aminovorans]
MPVYSQRIAATRSLSDAPLGTVFLPGRVEPDPLTDNLMAALPDGSVWLDPRSGFASGSWTDRKSGEVFALGTNTGAAMPTVVQDAQNGQRGLLFSNGTSGCPLVSASDDIWPIGASYTLVAMIKPTGEASAVGGIAANQRIETSQTGGVQTGASRFGYVVSASVLALNHQTRDSAGATTTNIVQSVTGAAAGTAAQMWMASFDRPGGAAELWLNGAVNRAVASGITRQNEEGHLVVGAAGYIPGTVYNPLRYANLLGLIMVPGLALHQSGSQQTEIRQAIETYARGKLAIW